MEQNIWQKLLLSTVLGFFASIVLAHGVTGAGASFPAPVYNKWADAYNKETKIKINYQSMGSSAGVNQIKAKTVDFGATDKPLSDKELKQANLLQFPTIIGGVVPVVNITGVKPGQLVLNGDVLGKIYLGEIKRWDDAKIKALNPQLKLPSKKINVVTRADGSGTTFVFTSYLSKVNTNWKAKVGVGSSVKWPVGTGGKGNEGVSAFVSRLPNSIGYVEYAYSKQNSLAYVLLINRAGKKVSPNDTSFKAAAEGIDWKRSFSQDMTDVKNDKAWPISTATYILMYKKPQKPQQSAITLKFFNWAFNKGDKVALEIDYVPLPEAVKKLIREEWKKITDSNGKSLQY